MKTDEEPITVFSTFPRVTDIDLPARLKHVPLSGASHLDLAKAYLSNRREERCFMFNGLRRQVWTIALLKMLLPNRRRKLVVVDMILSVPSTRKDWLVVSARRKLFAKVDLFISYARNTKGIEEIYRIPASRISYVPFKVNDWDTLRALETGDDGYIVVAGQTRRDFDTFRRAIEGLSIPIRIVAPAQSTLSQHGSVLSDEGWPGHVTFVRNAQTPEAFLPQLARARLVVLPILEKNITPSGIGVCLVAMALGKCVVVSSGPVADGLVDSGEAIVVPAGDWVALRDAITNACTDAELRTATAQKGFAYATALGDEKRLHRDLFQVVAHLCQAEA